MPDTQASITRCPRCAADTLTWPSPKNFECSTCGFVLYLNAAAAVAVIAECRGKVLFGLRKNDPGKGMLDLPGGFVDAGETAEEAARREVKEETGIEMGEMRYLFSLPNTYPYRGIVYDTLDLVFSVSFHEPPATQAGDDLTELIWIERDRIDYDRIAFISLREAVRRYLSL